MAGWEKTIRLSSIAGKSPWKTERKPLLYGKGILSSARKEYLPFQAGGGNRILRGKVNTGGRGLMDLIKHHTSLGAEKKSTATEGEKKRHQLIKKPSRSRKCVNGRKERESKRMRQTLLAVKSSSRKVLAIEAKTKTTKRRGRGKEGIRAGCLQGEKTSAFSAMGPSLGSCERKKGVSDLGKMIVERVKIIDWVIAGGKRRINEQDFWGICTRSKKSYSQTKPDRWSSEEGISADIRKEIRRSPGEH